MAESGRLQRLIGRTAVVAARSARPTKLRLRSYAFLVAVGVLAALLGLIGWAKESDQRPDLDLDRWSIVYRTIQLFAAEAGDSANVAWQLDTARILAPFALGGTFVLAVMGFASPRLQSLAARRSTGHSIAVGTAVRIERLLVMQGEEPKGILQAYGEGDSIVGAGPAVATDLSGTHWVSETNVAQCSSVLIAGESDDRTLAFVMAAMEHAPASARILADVQSREVMLALGLWSMLERPTVDLDVVSLDQAEVAATADALASESALVTEPLAVVLVGGSDMSDKIGQTIVETLTIQHAHSGRAARTLFVLIESPDAKAIPDETDHVEVISLTVAAAIQRCRSRTTWVVVEDSGASDCIADALKIATALSRAQLKPLGALRRIDDLQLSEQRSVDRWLWGIRSHVARDLATLCESEPPSRVALAILLSSLRDLGWRVTVSQSNELAPSLSRGQRAEIEDRWRAVKSPIDPSLNDLGFHLPTSLFDVGYQLSPPVSRAEA